jgi:hypothetical protein|tara:strand:+ start:631 stop:768 length:138 start_codon:yes stop_codon:yes gene_type:complete
MKIKIELEIDTESEQDLNTIEEMIDKLQDLVLGRKESEPPYTEDE